LNFNYKYLSWKNHLPVKPSGTSRRTTRRSPLQNKKLCKRLMLPSKRTLIDLFVMKEETIYLEVYTGMQMSYKE
jgi:hypothetical protein